MQLIGCHGTYNSCMHLCLSYQSCSEKVLKNIAEQASVIHLLQGRSTCQDMGAALLRYKWTYIQFVKLSCWTSQPTASRFSQRHIAILTSEVPNQRLLSFSAAISEADMNWGDLVLVLVVLNSITTLMPDMAVAQNPLLPFLPPVFSGTCNRSAYCGRGSCQVSQENRFGFVCECDSGWSQIRNYSIFPCVIPNCTINYSCANTSESQMASTMPTLTNISLYNPCSYSYCGGGSCVQTSRFNYRCNCNDGFHNLFNQSNYPCYRDCSLGADCTNLGITLTNSSFVSPFSPYSPPSSSNNRDASSLGSFTPNILLLGIVVSAIPLILAREV